MKEKIIQEIKDKNLICTKPWTFFEISPDGTVFCCCPEYTDFIPLGNIFEQTFDEIWNGRKITELRNNILENKYCNCNLELCYGIEHPFFINKDNFIYPKLPIKVNLSIDESCNVACLFCRDKKYHISPHSLKEKNIFQILKNKLLHFNNTKINNSEHIQEQELLKQKTEMLKKNIEMIDSFYIPLLKNAQTLLINGSGEFFVSVFYKELLQKTTKLYPDLKYQIITNGLLCNEKFLKRFGIIDNLDLVILSLHATTEKTYNKLVKGSNFNIIINNLKFLSELKEKGKLNSFILMFVITSLNYKEIPQFITMAHSFNAVPQLWPVRQERDCKFCSDDFDKYDVSNPNHPEHQEYLKILQDPVFKKYKIITNDLISSCNDQIQNVFIEE